MKKNIAVLMGGFSREAAVSFESGATVLANLCPSKYVGYGISITREGWWWENGGKKYPIDKNDFSLTIEGQKIDFHCVFNAIHGTPGEDGKLQSYFELIGKPLTGCSMYASALTFNKRDMLSTLKPFGIKMAKSVYLNASQAFSAQEIEQRLGFPCFVKANRSGSSIGVYKVYNQAELLRAITEAFQVDSELLIEEYLRGTEVSVGVLTFKGAIKVLPITEIVSENDFFDYRAKYEGLSKEITPARLSPALTQQVEQTALRVYELLQMRGFSRSEFILVDNQPYLLEMNTTPGLTAASILPQQAAAAGISLQELFSNAIEEVLEQE